MTLPDGVSIRFSEEDENPAHRISLDEATLREATARYRRLASSLDARPIPRGGVTSYTSFSSTAMPSFTVDGRSVSPDDLSVSPEDEE